MSWSRLRGWLAGALATALVVGGVVLMWHWIDRPSEETNLPGDAGGGGGQAPTDAELIAQAMVLESRDHGPQLCLGGVMESYPPQCGGPDLSAWDWAGLHAESASGSTWGDYVVIGHYDPAANSFTLTRDAVPADEYDGPLPPAAQEDEPWHTPCDEPAGGWVALDPDRTTEQTQNETFATARDLPDYAGSWVDQSINPAADDEPSLEMEQSMNDPQLLIINVAVTGDTDVAEQILRETWGGSLCVSHAEYTEQELHAVQKEVFRDTEDILFGSSTLNHVEIGVTYDDGSLQARFDEQYGPDVVQVSSALQPYVS